MRIVTYNIRGGLGLDGRRSIGRVAETLRALRPDVVCFQEVHQRTPWGGLTDQPRRLGRLLAMRFVFQRTIDLGFGGYGIGIATRLPVRSVARHALPGGAEGRGALQAELETPDGAVRVFCTHWGLDPEERDRQAALLARLVRSAGGPTTVCGDLNAGPHDGCVRGILEGAGLCDADAERDRPTFPGGAPTRRIDYILFTPALRAERVDVGDSRASDHLPLAADLLRA
ncbi:MAG: endonuclease/exonuclease/phosphatase family protein [Chthonomonadales bacterium]|nr:endonuclease/exonuclease/phosphatase family protein [Chthonomonadales bacterium]